MYFVGAFACTPLFDWVAAVTIVTAGQNEDNLRYFTCIKPFALCRTWDSRHTWNWQRQRRIDAKTLRRAVCPQRLERQQPHGRASPRRGFIADWRNSVSAGPNETITGNARNKIYMYSSCYIFRYFPARFHVSRTGFLVVLSVWKRLPLPFDHLKQIVTIWTIWGIWNHQF